MGFTGQEGPQARPLLPAGPGTHGLGLIAVMVDVPGIEVRKTHRETASHYSPVHLQMNVTSRMSGFEAHS